MNHGHEEHRPENKVPVKSRTLPFIKNLFTLAALAFIAFSVVFFYQAGNRLRQEQETQLLIERVIDAHGGREAIAKITAFKALGKLESWQVQSEPAEYSLAWSSDEKLRVDIRAGEFHEIQVLNHETGFVEATGSTISPAIGFRRRVLRYRYIEAYVPYHLAAGRFEIRNDSISESRGTRAHVLTLLDEQTPVASVYIDSDTHQILKTALLLKDDAERTELTSEYGDFRPVQGVLFPFHKKTFIKGAPEAEIKFHEYHPNPLLDPRLFEINPAQ